MIEIYVDEISERLNYTFNFILKDNGIDFQFNNDHKSFINSDNPKWNYSERFIEDVPQFSPSSLLFEEKIEKYRISKGEFGREECLTFNGLADPFASVFYILSRMEEYGEILHDDHDRFPANQSIQYKFGWLEKLVVERWSREIIHYFNELGLTNKEYTVRDTEIIPTFDIDNAYAYLLKDGGRKWLSVIKDYTKRNKKRVEERKKVLAGELKDPYDTYDIIQSVSDRGFKVLCFWLLGDYTQFDRNISHRHPKQKRLIRKVNQFAQVGIHPSYKTATKQGQLQEEVKRLDAILDIQTQQSRQHFLKFRLPRTYRDLIDAGICDDYSMGYASKVGFRAGTCRPFKWFDLEKNHTSNLTIHPFAYMDGTLNEYLKLSPEQAKVSIHTLYKEMKQFGGEFICLWHNETIGDNRHWKGWYDVLEYTLNLRGHE